MSDGITYTTVGDLIDLLSKLPTETLIEIPAPGLHMNLILKEPSLMAVVNLNEGDE